jgi:hypothetical protein
MSIRSRLRRFGAALGASALTIATFGILAGTTALPAGAVGTGSSTANNLVGAGSVTATPGQDLSSNEVLNLTGTGLPDGTAALLECANAKSDGSPITAAEQGAQWCFGAADVGTNLFLISVSGGSLPANQTYTLRTSGIGVGPDGIANGAPGDTGDAGRCVPRQPGMLPCIIQLADVGTQGTVLSVRVPVTLAGSAPPPTLVTTGVSNQSNASAGRIGNVITVGGANWQNTASGFTVELCTAANHTGCTAFVTQSVSAAGNALGGTATIPAGVTAGNRYLFVSNTNGDTASEPFLVLGTPTVSLSPSAGGPGTQVTVSGTNWDTGSTVHAFESDGVNPIGPMSLGSANNVGNISAGLVVTVNNSSTVAIGVVQGAGFPPVPDLFPGTATPIAGGATFSLSNTSCVPSGQTIVPGGATTGGPNADGATPDGCELLQNINLTVNGGTLTFSEAGSSVTMNAITLNGADQTSTGGIQELTVLDARGSLSGWVVLATMTDLTDGSAGATPANHHAIPAGNMSTTTITCAPESSSTGVATDVAAGAGGSFDPTTPITLCTAAPGGGGGTFKVNAGLSLLVPASIAAGQYVAQMTLLIT